MKLANYLKTWKGTKAENRWSRLFIALLLFISLILIVAVLNKKTIVIIQPTTLTKEAQVSINSASESYKEGWAMFLAELTGNVTPATASFIQDKIGPLLDPKIYREAVKAMQTQVKQIKHDGITYRFEPKQVIYEPQSNKVFVEGISYQTATTGETVKDEKTYEYVIDIVNYQPLIRYIDVYQGPPKTLPYLRKLNAMQHGVKHDA
ncbi:TraE/TraK family type IV conjugative transfer system protein [Piscirickettsia litoralis]|uniref:Pilus assembly protein n=1 Tax=Piscirickettsia litoralis TaxID=1891921 RepID=A0ABX2ZXU7_9GAMM|nr:TraE/TraK family type IV conjugative transfer system protein [Piscirickettsia litoralis]ODN41402.1 hypothetical protein BGC07_16690 [Piscirickettsia litoralis]